MKTPLSYLRLLIAAGSLAAVALLASGCGASTPTPIPAFRPTIVATGVAATVTPNTSDNKEKSVVADGDTVEVHYRGTLDNGEEFDTSYGSTPLSFTVGAGQVIKGFNDAVIGMKVGEKKSVHIPVDEAYGPHMDDLVFEVARTQTPPDIQQGDQVRLSNGFPAVITAVTTDTVRIDANHTLAGQALNFEIELVTVK